MILVLCEHAAGELDDRSRQALTLARRLADGAEDVHALLIGPGGEAAAPAVAEHGAVAAHVATDGRLSAYAPAAWAATAIEVAERASASAIVAAGTDRGNEVLAHVAARLARPLAVGCVALTAGDPLAVVRSRWGGSLLEEAELARDGALLTVTPHAIAAERVPDGRPAELLPFTPELSDPDLVVRVSEHAEAQHAGISLAEAKVVVSGGRGVGSAEGFAEIEELASLLGAAVGCSRAVTMAGWRPHTDQIGQTGTKIAPDIYIACGISGATQHMAGCRGAKLLLAVNSDPEASILASADYAVIGDLHEVVPAISAAVRKVGG